MKYSFLEITSIDYFYECIDQEYPIEYLLINDADIFFYILERAATMILDNQGTEKDFYIMALAFYKKNRNIYKNKELTYEIFMDFIIDKPFNKALYMEFITFIIFQYYCDEIEIHDLLQKNFSLYLDELCLKYDFLNNHHIEQLALEYGLLNTSNTSILLPRIITSISNGNINAYSVLIDYYIKIQNIKKASLIIKEALAYEHPYAHYQCISPDFKLSINLKVELNHCYKSSFIASPLALKRILQFSPFFYPNKPSEYFHKTLKTGILFLNEYCIFESYKYAFYQKKWDNLLKDNELSSTLSLANKVENIYIAEALKEQALELADQENFNFSLIALNTFSNDYDKALAKMFLLKHNFEETLNNAYLIRLFNLMKTTTTNKGDFYLLFAKYLLEKPNFFKNTHSQIIDILVNIYISLSLLGYPCDFYNFLTFLDSNPPLKNEIINKSKLILNNTSITIHFIEALIKLK